MSYRRLIRGIQIYGGACMAFGFIFGRGDLW